MRWLALFALALAACAGAPEIEVSRRAAADLVCVAPRAVQCAREGCAPWRTGQAQTMALSIEMPAQAPTGVTRICVRGACGEAFLESHPPRGRSRTRYVIWHRETPAQGLSGPIEVHPDGRTFELTLEDMHNRYTWHGRCSALPSPRAGG